MSRIPDQISRMFHQQERWVGDNLNLTYHCRTLKLASRTTFRVYGHRVNCTCPMIIILKDHVRHHGPTPTVCCMSISQEKWSVESLEPLVVWHQVLILLLYICQSCRLRQTLGNHHLQNVGTLFYGRINLGSQQ
jgi:hypothetical protein